MGYVSIWMLIVSFRMCCGLWGVCKFIVRFTWLCMHIIDVSNGSTFGSFLATPMWGRSVGRSI